MESNRRLNMTKPSNLKSGYYWIKVYETSKWEIAHYDLEYNIFETFGSTEPYLFDSIFEIDSNIIERYTNKNKAFSLLNKLDNLNINESFNKVLFINSIWGAKNKSSMKSFDVIYCNTKKTMKNKQFEIKNGMITRIK